MLGVVIVSVWHPPGTNWQLTLRNAPTFTSANSTALYTRPLVSVRGLKVIPLSCYS